MSAMPHVRLYSQTRINVRSVFEETHGNDDVEDNSRASTNLYSDVFSDSISVATYSKAVTVIAV